MGQIAMPVSTITLSKNASSLKWPHKPASKINIMDSCNSLLGLETCQAQLPR